MIELLKATEIEYAKCFSNCIEEEKYYRFIDDNIPDMYSHNFILLKAGLSNKDINNIIVEEFEYRKKQGKSFLQLEANFSIDLSSLEGVKASSEITKYYYMAIPAHKYKELRIKDGCAVKAAVENDVLLDGMKVDIEACSEAMGNEFAKRRIERKVQAYKAANNLEFYVCYDNDTPVGDCELFINGAIAKIEDFDILEKYQRKGFGTSVLRHLMLAAEEHGVETAYVITDSEDTAKDMYKKCGFEIVGEKTAVFLKLEN